MKSTLILFFFCLGLISFSQEKNIEFSIGLSPTSYKGDLNKSYSKFGFGWNASLNIINNKFASSSLQVSNGSFSGEQSFSSISNLPSDPFTPYFKTSFLSVNYGLNFNFIRKKNLYITFTPGIGLLRFDSKDIQGNKLIDLLDTRGDNEIYSTNTLILPISFSFKYIFLNDISINLATKWLGPQTDYIDNTSEFGSVSGNDKIFQYNISIGVPIKRNFGEQHP